MRWGSILLLLPYFTLVFRLDGPSGMYFDADAKGISSPVIPTDVWLAGVWGPGDWVGNVQANVGEWMTTNQPQESGSPRALGCLILM